MPWVTATTIFGDISKSGTDGDGVITAVIGAVAAVVLYLASTKAQRSGFTAGAVLSVLGGLVAVLNFFTVSDSVSEASSEYVIGRVGVGLYLCVGGAIAAVVGALVARSKASPDEPKFITFPDAPPPSA